MDTLRFLPPDKAALIAQKFGTPTYVYDAQTLRKQADAALAFPNAYGITVRYAMKACSNASILKIFKKAGLHIDASSGYEVQRALRAGFEPEQILLSTQELPENFAEFLDKGVCIDACSLSQLERIGQARPAATIGMRLNPGLGSGGTGKTNVGGPDASFGIWHEWIPQAKELLEKYRLTCVRLHSHIGSGGDPAVWQRVAIMNLNLAEQFPTAKTLNLGGGYKVARVEGEKATDLQEIGLPVKDAFEDFAKRTGRKLYLEIEPGTFLMANSGVLLTKVQDIVRTSSRIFYKLDSGMTDILRPSLYGAQHTIGIYSTRKDAPLQNTVVVGHCCESGDLLTPAPNNPESIAERPLPQAQIGDLCAIGSTGAYCAAMCAKNYNSFPEAAEALVEENGNIALIRRRQTLDQILQNECYA